MYNDDVGLSAAGLKDVDTQPVDKRQSDVRFLRHRRPVPGIGINKRRFLSLNRLS